MIRETDVPCPLCAAPAGEGCVPCGITTHAARRERAEALRFDVESTGRTQTPSPFEPIPHTWR